MNENPFTNARRFRKELNKKRKDTMDNNTLKAKFGNKDRELFYMAIEDGQMALRINKPSQMSWQEFLATIKFTIASGLSQQSGLSVPEVILWLEGVPIGEEPPEEDNTSSEPTLTEEEKKLFIEQLKRERIKKLEQEDLGEGEDE